MIAECRCDDRELQQLSGEEAHRYTRHLVELRDDAQAWETEFECPNVHARWLLDYPHSEYHGGGPSRLRRLPLTPDRKGMRQEVRELATLGPLPLEERVVGGDLTEEEYNRWADRIQRITSPVSDDEARALASIFPPEGSAFGVAWTVLHLIETAPHWPLADVLAANPSNEWIDRLRRRLENAQHLRREDSGDT